MKYTLPDFRVIIVSMGSGMLPDSKFYCRASLRKDALLAGKSSLCFSPI